MRTIIKDSSSRLGFLAMVLLALFVVTYRVLLHEDVVQTISLFGTIMGFAITLKGISKKQENDQEKIELQK